MTNGKSFCMTTAILALGGCGASEKDAEEPEAPKACAKWVDKGSGFFSGDHGKAFHGVGAANGIGDVSLRRNAADMDARTNLARQISVRIEALIEAYRASTSDKAREALERHTQEVQRQLTDMSLAGVAIVDRCFNRPENTQYALAVLDAKAFREQIGQMRGLDEEAKAVIRENAEKALERLDDQLSKHRQ